MVEHWNVKTRGSSGNPALVNFFFVHAKIDFNLSSHALVYYLIYHSNHTRNRTKNRILKLKIFVKLKPLFENQNFLTLGVQMRL